MLRFFLSGIVFLLQILTLYSQTTLKGDIRAAKGQPVIGANIYFKGTIEGTNSDEQGSFLLSTGLEGDQILVVSCIGYKTHEEQIALSDIEIELHVTLSESEIELNEVTVYAGTFEAGDKTKSVVLNRLDMATNPIGFGDALSAFRTLPGTSNAGDEGGLIVRGGEQNETKTFVDGLLVKSPYTAKLPNVPVRGRFSPMLFRGTVFSTGGYSAEFGQALSSVLLLNSIDRPEKEEAGISLFFSGANFSKTALWDNSSLSVSSQYANMAPFYRIIKSNIKWDHAPENFNQMIAFRRKISKHGLMKIMTNFSIDNSSMYYRNLDTKLDDHLSLKNSDLFFVSSYRGVIGKDWMINSGISYNIDNEDIHLNTDDIDDASHSYEFKLSFTKPVNKLISLKFGGNYFYEDYSRDFLPITGDLYKWKFNNPIVAAFIESEIKLTGRISMRIGGRSEIISLSDESYISPRFSMAYKTSANSQLSIGYGTFSEQPVADYLLYNNKLKTEQADHYIINYQFTKNSRIFRIEAYYKDYTRLIKYDSLYATIPDAYNNKGFGYAKGLDLFFRDSKTINNGDFWISYSLIDSKRNYRDYNFEHSPFYISKHNLSFVYKHYISKTDSYISAGYEYSSGRPYLDPNIDLSELQKTRSYNSLSLSIFHFTEIFGKFTMIFAQVTNLLGKENTFGYKYAKNPDMNGVYESEAIVPVSKRFWMVGISVSFNGQPEI